MKKQYSEPLVPTYLPIALLSQTHPTWPQEILKKGNNTNFMYFEHDWWQLLTKSPALSGVKYEFIVWVSFLDYLFCTDLHFSIAKDNAGEQSRTKVQGSDKANLTYCYFC